MSVNGNLYAIFMAFLQWVEIGLLMMHRLFANTYRSFVFRLSASNNFLFICYYKYFYRPKAGSLDSFIDFYSKNTSDFFVVQIGANDGISHDPIHKFIKRDLWRGVLLEPQKYVFEKFLSKIYRKNKGIIPLNAAISKEDGKTTIFRIAFSNSRWATGLTSFRKDVIVKAFENGYVEWQAKKERKRVPEKWEERIIAEEVSVVSAKSLIEKFAVSKIDLLMIDAEGFDFEVIKLFENIEPIPKVIILENSHLTVEELGNCTLFLEEKGYSHRNYGASTLAIYKPNEKLFPYLTNP